MKPAKEFIKPFRMGDVVLVKKAEDSFFNGINIIDSVHVASLEDYRYSTDRGAWIDHRDMTLVRECDKKSMTALLKAERE